MDRRKNERLAYHVRTAMAHLDRRSEILHDRRVNTLRRILYHYCNVRVILSNLE